MFTEPEVDRSSATKIRRDYRAAESGGGALGQAEMPGGVLLPGVRLEERVLLPCARLHVLPTRAEHVLAGVDQLLRVPDASPFTVQTGTRLFSPTRATSELGRVVRRSGRRRPAGTTPSNGAARLVGGTRLNSIWHSGERGP